MEVYCYSNNNESYSCHSDTREEALEEAKKKYPDNDKIWTGRSIKMTAKNFLNIENLFESLQESADDLCGEVAEDWLPSWKKDQDKKQELVKLISEFIDKNWPVNFWLVDDVIEHNIEGKDGK